MKKNKRKSILSVLAVMIMLMATLLTACGSGAASAVDTGATKVETTEEEAAAPVETAELVAEEAAEVESTAEPTPEDTKYAGIDMESTLPGLEWMDTFDGIINEPKLVVFNDETNKKVIVENGETVEFSPTDIMATYVPADKESSAKYLLSDSFKNKEYAGRYTIETELQSGFSEIGIKFQHVNIVIYGDDEVKLKAVLQIVE